MIVRVSVVLRRTVVGSGDWRFDNLSGSHHQSQIKLHYYCEAYQVKILTSFNSFCFGKHAQAFKHKTNGFDTTEVPASALPRTSKQTWLYQCVDNMVAQCVKFFRYSHGFLRKYIDCFTRRNITRFRYGLTHFGASISGEN